MRDVGGCRHGRAHERRIGSAPGMARNEPSRRPETPFRVVQPTHALQRRALPTSSVRSYPTSLYHTQGLARLLQSLRENGAARACRPPGTRAGTPDLACARDGAFRPGQRHRPPPRQWRAKVSRDPVFVWIRRVWFSRAAVAVRRRLQRPASRATRGSVRESW